MSINISGPLGRSSLEHRRSIRTAGYLGTCLAAWAIGCTSSNTTVSEGTSGQGGSSAVATGGTQSSPTTGGASQAATGGTPASGGKAAATGGSPAQTGG